MPISWLARGWSRLRGLWSPPLVPLATKGYFVLGMHRSGTSCLTGVLETAGLWLGFSALLAGKSITRSPRFILVQAEACAPVYRAWSGVGDSVAVADAASRAEGIMIREPVRLASMLQAVASSGGMVTCVSESEIEAGRDLLGRAGISAEPTSAVVVGGLRRAMAAGALGSSDEGEVVVVVSGHGLKAS